jgi:hypothetical protein
MNGSPAKYLDAIWPKYRIKEFTMAKTFRQLVTLVESLHTPLDEAGAGPSRVVQHIRDGNIFIMLSAMRADLKRSENLRRTEKLKAMLTSLPVSFIETEGEYHEEGQPEPSRELSFFVMPKRGARKLTAEQFRHFGIKLMHAFDQDSILYGDGKLASLIFSDGSTADLGDTLTFRPEVIETLGGFSKIRGRKFSFTDKPTASMPVEPPDRATTKGVTYGDVAA